MGFSFRSGETWANSNNINITIIFQCFVRLENYISSWEGGALVNFFNPIDQLNCVPNMYIMLC